MAVSEMKFSQFSIQKTNKLDIIVTLYCAIKELFLSDNFHGTLMFIVIVTFTLLLFFTLLEYQTV